MKRIASILIGAFFVAASSAIALAQGGASSAPAAPPAAAPAAPESAASAAPAPAAGEHAEEVEAFHNMLKMHHRMWRRLKQNPNVVTNDSWVEKYPDLRDFFNRHSGAKERFLASPGVYLEMNEAKALRREKHRGAGGS